MPDTSRFLYDDELEKFFDEHFEKSLFRLEVLDFYEPDREQFELYQSGKSGPDLDRRKPWLDYIKSEADAGHSMRRVHIVRSPLSDYLKFECEWGYAYNVQAGEQIRILDRAEKPLGDDVILEDFWIFDDKYVVVMHYDDKGAFVKGEVLPEDQVSRYRLAQNAVWADGEPFSEYWSSHPQNGKAHQHA
jgi:hypothetical protein